MRKILFVCALAVFAGGSSAESANRLRISGKVSPSCDLQTESITLSRQLPGTWTGEAFYSCNAPHVITVGLGPDMADAEVSVGGLIRRAGKDGEVRIYRAGAHFGSASVAIQAPSLDRPQIRMSFQPL